MRKKRMLAELDLPLAVGEGDPDLGDAEGAQAHHAQCQATPTLGTLRTCMVASNRSRLRVTRSNREFNPHVIKPEILTIIGVQSEQLLREGCRISNAAWEEGVEEDTELLDTTVQLDLAAPFSTPVMAIFKPLEELLRPVDLQPRAKHPRLEYVPNMELTAAERKKIKDHHRSRNLWAKKRSAIQTKSKASICSFVGPCATAWTGSRAPVPYPKIHSVLDVLALSGLQYVEWDARVYKSKDGLHWAALLGYGGDCESWLKNMENLDQLLLQAHQKLRFPKHSQPPRRGEYDPLSVGYSHGQGQLHPMNFAVSKHNCPILQGLLESPEIIRVARFMDRGCITHWGDGIFFSRGNLLDIM
ncbi:hypothetical protein F5051DRAFT_446310 [Lentinula edodes]|nr:hypothetical protein F5051DRAFT_446310 [Lentinula edodes]